MFHILKHLVVVVEKLLMHDEQRKICLHSQCMFYGIDHAGSNPPHREEREQTLKKAIAESRLNQQKLSNKISFYYPFIKFIEDIDLTTNIKTRRTRRRRYI